MKFIPIASPNLEHKEARAVFKTVKSGWISMGKKVQEFEKRVAQFTKAKYAIAMNNGTSTLDSILTALQIKENDEVIVPSLTYISTANVALYKKAKLVLCDSNKSTFNIEPDSILQKITKKTKLIIVTDMKGMPVDYDFFKKLSQKTNIPIIADSAESLGAEYKNKKVGNQLLAHSFSFFANKNITTGEGGMVVTNSKHLSEKLRIIRNQGQNTRYNHIILGNNYRMPDILAAIGIEQIKKLKKIIIKKNKIAAKYNKELSKIKDLKIPYIPSYVSQHAWYNYAIRVNPRVRNKLINYLRNKKIETRLSFPPIHTQPYYKEKFKFTKKYAPQADEVYKEFIDIPIWTDLKTIQQTRIINSIKFFFNN